MRSVLLASSILLLAAASARADLTITMGGQWQIVTRARVVACVAGQCDSDATRRTDVLNLPAGTIIRTVLQVFSCGGIELADYCDLSPRPTGKVAFVDCDKAVLGPLVRSCSPYPSLRLRRVGGFERMADDGKSFKTKASVRFTVRVSGHTVTVNATVTVDGTLLAAKAAGDTAGPGSHEIAPIDSDLIESLIGRVVGQ